MKEKRGRKPIPEDHRKSKSIHTRYTQAQMDQIKSRAEREYMSPAAWVRQVVLRVMTNTRNAAISANHANDSNDMNAGGIA